MPMENDEYYAGNKKNGQSQFQKNSPINMEKPLTMDNSMKCGMAERQIYLYFLTMMIISSLVNHPTKQCITQTYQSAV